jgi:hypothetical protein
VLRRESGKPNRKRKKPGEPERTVWCLKSSKNQLNVSPMCARLRVRNRRKVAAHQSRYVPDPQSSVDDRSGARDLCRDRNAVTRN